VAIEQPTRLAGSRRRPPGAIPSVEGIELLAALPRPAGPGEPDERHALFVAALAICLGTYAGDRIVVLGVGAPPRALVLDLAAAPSFRELGTAARAGLSGPCGDGCQAFDVVCRPADTAPPPIEPVLDVRVRPTDAGLEVRVDVDTTRIEIDQARAFRDHLAWVFAAGWRRPDAAVREIAAASPAAVELATRSWARGPADPDAAAGGPDATLHRMFERQARRRPRAIALRAAGEAVAYEELDRRAGLLAHRLVRERGVGPGSVVGIALPRSVAYVTAVLGVLAAGAAYVPVDPDDPPDRIGQVLAGAGAELVLTAPDARDRLPATGPPVACLDDGPAGTGPSGPGAAVPPEAPACVIATSGTTGAPKCVRLTHRGLAGRVRWERAELGIGPADRFLQLASVGFSVAVLEVLAPLCAGAALVLGPPGRTRTAGAIARAVREHRVTVLSLVPPELELLLGLAGDMDWSSVRLVVTGGDVLPATTAERFRSACPAASLVNLYGTTETSCEATWWPCPGRPLPGPVPIGRPTSGVTAYVLDDELRPLPPGAPGELCIGGASLASGYVGRPALTADRFVPDPFSDGGRLYRTGDRGRWLPGGALEALGRLDQQVQVHGIRLEPEEVEAALRQHPSVADAAVVIGAGPRDAAAPAPRDEEGWTRLLAGVDGEELDRLLAEVGGVLR